MHYAINLNDVISCMFSWIKYLIDCRYRVCCMLYIARQQTQISEQAGQFGGVASNIVRLTRNLTQFVVFKQQLIVNDVRQRWSSRLQRCRTDAAVCLMWREPLMTYLIAKTAAAWLTDWQRFVYGLRISYVGYFAENPVITDLFRFGFKEYIYLHPSLAIPKSHTHKTVTTLWTTFEKTRHFNRSVDTIFEINKCLQWYSTTKAICKKQRHRKL